MSSSQGEQFTQLHSGGRTVRLIIYGRFIDDVQRIWVDWRAKYGDVVNELAKLDSSGNFVVLRSHWGPKPRWSVPDTGLDIETACQVLYAIFMGKPMRYIVGLVRTRQSDYPIAIFEAAKERPRTISQAVTASNPELNKLVKSITRYSNDQDVSGHLIDYDELERYHPSTFPTVIIITVEKSPSDLMPDLSSTPVPVFLQIPFAYCKHLTKRAYDLKYFSLQMIHVSRAIGHVIVCLVQGIGDLYENDARGVEAALSAGGDLADLLRIAPLYSRALQALLDKVNGVMVSLESGTFVRSEIQNAVEDVFDAICGEYPGAVTVRHSHELFKDLGNIEREEENQNPPGNSDVANVNTASVKVDRVDYHAWNPALRTEEAIGDIDIDMKTHSSGETGNDYYEEEDEFRDKDDENYGIEDAHYNLRQDPSNGSNDALPYSDLGHDSSTSGEDAFGSAYTPSLTTISTATSTAASRISSRYPGKGGAGNRPELFGNLLSANRIIPTKPQKLGHKRSLSAQPALGVMETLSPPPQQRSTRAVSRFMLPRLPVLSSTKERKQSPMTRAKNEVLERWGDINLSPRESGEVNTQVQDFQSRSDEDIVFGRELAE